MSPDRVSGLFWLAFGLLCMYGSIRLGLGTLREPGTGFFPFLTAGFACLMALWVLVRAFLRKKGTEARISSFWQGKQWHQPLIVAILMAGYVLVLEKVGFLLTSFVVLLLMLKLVEKFPWWKAITISVCASGLTYLVFHVLLKTTLPVGIFRI
jgi:putative tricarboxylic transport membrane protein